MPKFPSEDEPPPTKWTEIAPGVQICHPRSHVSVVMVHHMPMTEEQLQKMDELIKSVTVPMQKLFMGGEAVSKDD